MSTKDYSRIIMAIVAHFDLELHQIDVRTTFLNGDLVEDVYMSQPIGFEEVGKECDAPNPTPSVKRGCHFFFFPSFPVYYKLINFKLGYSYNVKHLTCTIFCSSGLQNIYKLHIWKCSKFTIFTLFTKKKKNIYKNRPKGL